MRHDTCAFLKLVTLGVGDRKQDFICLLRRVDNGWGTLLHPRILVGRRFTVGVTNKVNGE